MILIVSAISLTSQGKSSMVDSMTLILNWLSNTHNGTHNEVSYWKKSS